MRISGSKTKIMTHGIPYKFTLLKEAIINTLWEICDHFPLAYLNSMKPMELGRGHVSISQAKNFRLIQAKIS